MEPTTINVAALLLVLSGIIAKIVERIRAKFPLLDGDLVTLLAVLAGGGLAYALDLRGAAELAASAGIELGAIPAWLDYALTGIGLGLGAGIVNDIIRKKPTITLAGEVGRHEELPDQPSPGH